MRQQTRSERETATGRLLIAYHADGDDRARERLVRLYMPLVEALANRYGLRGAEHEELVQAGSIGLLNAIERFDQKRGDAFPAFAVPTIAGQMRRFLRENPARMPEDAVEAGANGEEAENQLLPAGAFDVLDDTERRLVYLRFVREVSRREAAAELGMTAEQLRRRTREALAKLRAGLEDNAFPNVAQETPGAAGKPEPEATAAPEPKRDDGDRPAVRRRGEGERSGRILVRMPPPVHDELAEAAEREGVSLNHFITNALMLAVHPERSDSQDAPAPRWLPAAIVTDIVVLVVASIAAVVLLLVAWQQGW
jgi:RNA polymerase sigma factor (sigma-70 family)